MDSVAPYRFSLHPSKGKRHARSKSKEARDEPKSNAQSADTYTALPSPAILPHITIGFNSTLRKLQSQAASSTPPEVIREGYSEQNPSSTETANLARGPGTQTNEGPDSGERNIAESGLAAIFVCSKNMADILLNHLPILAYFASRLRPSDAAVLLIRLPDSAEARLSEILAQPHASVLGILQDAPESKTLLEFVRERVPVTQVPWLQQAASGMYQPLHVTVRESILPSKMPGVKKAAKRRHKASKVEKLR